MKSAILPAALTMISACAMSETDRENALMNEIENSLIMPHGALKIEKYARYYTKDKDLVYGTFTTHTEVRPPNVSCSELTLDFDMVDTSCPAVADLKPGNRRWVSLSDYPAVGGDDCQGVDIVYNTRSRSVEYAECAVLDR